MSELVDDLLDSEGARRLGEYGSGRTLQPIHITLDGLTWPRCEKWLSERTRCSHPRHEQRVLEDADCP